MTPNDFLEKLGYTPLPLNDVQVEQALYEGFLKGFHEYDTYNGDKKVTRHRYTLGMGKKICEDWADNIINPETQVLLDSNHEWLDDTLDRIDFYNRATNLVENTFWSGLGAFVAYKDENTEVNFLDKQYIFPLRVVNGEIVDVAFVFEIESGIINYNIHLLEENGTYTVKNYFSDNEGNVLVIEDVEEKIYNQPKLFFIVKPAIANNKGASYDGLSILSNALDEIKAVDIAYTSFVNDMDYGRMRVYVYQDALDFKDEKPIFHKEQEEYYLINSPQEFDEKGVKDPIKVSTPQLRLNDLELGIEKTLTLLGRKVGFGDNAYSFEAGALYTNTSQVISTNSKFYKTRVKHSKVWEQAIKGLVEALYFLEFGNELNDTVIVDFDDSIIEDKSAKTQQAMIEYNAGLISEVEYHMAVRDLTRQEALEFVALMNADKGLEDDIEYESE